jgi:hypothetical protein
MLVWIHEGSFPFDGGRARPLPCLRAKSPQQLTISVHESLGVGSTEARAHLAGVLAVATVAGQTRT